MSNNLNQGASIEAEYLRWWIAIETDTRKSMMRGAHREPERLHALVKMAFCAGSESALRTPAAATGDGELPPLPGAAFHTQHGYVWLADQMRDYARAAIEADRAQRQAAPASAQPPLLQEAYRAIQNCVLALPEGQFKRDMDDWLTARLDVIEGPAIAPAPASAQPADPVSVFRQHVGMISTDDAAGPYLKVRFRTMAEADTAFDFVSRGLSAGAQPDQRESAAVPDEVMKVGARMAAWLYGLSKSALPFQSWADKCKRLSDEWDQIAAAPAAQPAKEMDVNRMRTDEIGVQASPPALNQEGGSNG